MLEHRAPSPEWSGFCAFLEDRVIRIETMGTTVRLVWVRYRAYCASHGFPQATEATFMAYLGSVEGIHLRRSKTARGRLKTLVMGMVTCEPR